MVEVLVGFGRTLRAAGVGADPDRMATFVAAVGCLDVTRAADVYWAGRLTLCADPDELARYDRCFAAYFGGETVSPGRRPPPPIVVVRPAPRFDTSAVQEGEPADPRAATASAVEVLRHRDVALLSASERAEIHRLVSLLRVARPRRPSRRYAPAAAGPVDARRTVRAVLRGGGELTAPLHRARRSRPRPVVIVIDVSGSMTPYADLLLRFAHAALRAGPRHTEVFSVGTRLTRLTRELRHRDPEAAMRAVAAAIPDWSGGTRLGEEIKEFLDRYGRRGTARGATVVIASDGWERGDAGLLGDQMAHLHRLAHRVIWVNPHRARPGYEPLTAGMAAALPHVDAFVAGHGLAAMEELAAAVG